jgi:glycosyltransferase involved in cell wall biosynthesis
MKIQFFHSKHGGPSVFMRRLRHYLVDHYDVKVTDKNPDLYLSAVWRGNPPKGVKVIHRVDNCYFDKLNKDRIRFNNKIKNAIKKADGVIYQSTFSLGMCNKILGVRGSKIATIHNGFDQSICSNIAPFRHKHKHLFVACALWRPIKRPQAIMRAFIKAEIPNSALVMIGDGIKKRPSNSNIICTGKLKPRETYQYYKAATAIVHISRMESCPNSVIEGLSFGKPIVCNNAGGTKEIVSSDGIIVKIDPPDNFKMFSMRDPESIDVKKVALAMREVVGRKWSIRRPDLSMSNCVEQYYSFFKTVIK